MSTEMYDAVIIGGGAAGMSSAWALRDRNILLLEEENRLGGRLFSMPRGEYWLNLGAHLFPGEGSRTQEMIKELGLEVAEIPGSKTGMFFANRVHVNKHIEAYPLTLPLTLRERWAFIRTGLRLLAVVKRWQRVARRRTGEDERDRLVRMSKYESGRTFRDVIGRPAGRVNQLFETSGRRASCDLEEQSASVGAALFGSHWSGKKDTNALNLIGGSSRLGDGIAAQLGDQVRLGARVTRVTEHPDGVEIEYSDREGAKTVHARAAVVAVPAPVARRIIDEISPELDRALGSVKYGQFVAMGMITNEETSMPWDDVYALTTPGLAFSMFFNHANPIRDGDRRPGGSLMCYAGGSTARALLDLSDDEIKHRFLPDLYRMYPQLKDVIVETVVKKWALAGQVRGPGDGSFDVLLDYTADTSRRIQLAGDYFAQLGQIEVAASTGFTAAQSLESGPLAGISAAR